jgi:hypothetical protein
MKLEPTWGGYYWPFFLIVASLLFLVPELIALFTNATNTLSDYSWRELNVRGGLHFDQHTAAWGISLAAWLVFVIVITLHIWWKSVP